MKKFKKIKDDRNWGCAYCNCANKSNAEKCINCGKKKKVGSPFHFSFVDKENRL